VRDSVGGGSKPAGHEYRDCDVCPEMVVVPAGKFRMGDLSGGGAGDEKPVHTVEIAKSFGVGKYEVTFAQWDACQAAGGCEHRPGDGGWGHGNRPVMNVSWNDAQAYVSWLSRRTGKRYRLLSESEWEYAARAGSATKYSWGNSAGRNNANCYGCGSNWDNKGTAPVGSFRGNGFGLHDMHGNVWEWTEDCWNESYSGAPADGRVWSSGDCLRRVLRGGSWNSKPRNLRSAFRNWYATANRDYRIGFRVAQDL
jgi:formylglycine-generating enzyme required for sulfatase activity